MFELCCYTSDTGQAEVAIWNMVHGLSPNHSNGKRHRAWKFCPCHERPCTCHTTKMGSPTLVLITHFAAEIILIVFLNQGCERLSLRFECLLTTDVAEFMHFLGILMVEQTLCTSETITHWALASNQQRTASHTCMTHECLLVTCPDYLLEALSDSHMKACAFIQSDATWKLWVIEKFWEHIWIQFQKYIRNRHFSSRDKIFVDHS